MNPPQIYMYSQILFTLYIGQQYLFNNHEEVKFLKFKYIFNTISKLQKYKLIRPIPKSRRRQWHPTLVLLPGKSHGPRAWWAVVHGVAKSRTRLSDFTFTFHFHALEKEMATHSSVLAWRIPGTGEPRGLPSVGSHRVRHD